MLLDISIKSNRKHHKTVLYSKSNKNMVGWLFGRFFIVFGQFFHINIWSPWLCPRRQGKESYYGDCDIFPSDQIPNDWNSNDWIPSNRIPTLWIQSLGFHWVWLWSLGICSPCPSRATRTYRNNRPNRIISLLWNLLNIH